MSTDSLPVFSVGHSNQPVESFIALLRKHNITRLVDVRSSPGSKANPQFNSEPLCASVVAAGIEYTHHKILGGREKGGDVSFRLRSDPQVSVALLGAVGRADGAGAAAAGAAASKAATAAAASSAAAAPQVRAALMCSEANWRECHRQNLIDFLVKVKNVPAFHILPNGDLEEHTARTQVVLTQRDAETAALVEKAAAPAADSQPSAAPDQFGPDKKHRAPRKNRLQ
jgi:uncharacterized protein (DUF488 family)